MTEAGPPDGRPVLALHGWPQHHWEYRDLLADPPPGLRIIAPDLPGYGWSGPAPHRWAKEDVARDVLALLDALGLDRVLLVAHDWGALRRLPDGAGARPSDSTAISREHGSPVGVAARTLLPHLWRFWYQMPLATFGIPVQQRTGYVERVIFGVGSEHRPRSRRASSPSGSVTRCAREPARDTYRTFLTREIPAGRKESRDAAGDGADPCAVRDGRLRGCSVRSSPPKPPTPTTTRSRRLTPHISSSTSVQIWCARS